MYPCPVFRGDCSNSIIHKYINRLADITFKVDSKRMIQAKVGSNVPSDFIKVYKFSIFSNGDGHMFDGG